MYLLAIPLIFIEIIVFALAVIAFFLALRFFIASRKRFEHLLPDRKQKRAYFGIDVDRDGFIVPAVKTRSAAASEHIPTDETRHELKELRDMVQLQQLELTRALRQIESLNTSKEEVGYDYESDDYEERDSPNTGDAVAVAELQQQLTRKEDEIKELRQQMELNQKVQSHFERMEADYHHLQEKVQKMESQSWQSAELAVKIDALEEAAEQAEKTIQKKEEKIRELTAETGRLRNRLHETEDRLSESAAQRQQLLKKMQFLDQINTDAKQMSDANRKMRAELRRMAELESMLNLITEERDVLLKRRRV